MEAVRDMLSTYIDPDSLGEVCQYVDPNFEPILFEQWHKVSAKDILYFSIAHAYFPMLQNKYSKQTRDKYTGFGLDGKKTTVYVLLIR